MPGQPFSLRLYARQTIRLWGRRPWHTGFAILALAIGIGANPGVFSVVNPGVPALVS